MSPLEGLLLPRLSQATPEHLGMLMLRDDPQYRRIPKAERDAWVRWALESGRALATQVDTAFDGACPEDIARRSGVDLVRLATDNRFDQTWQYAEYYTRPPCIGIYERAIQCLNAHLRGSAIGGALGLVDVTPVFVAHELHHHFEERDIGNAIGKKCRVTLARVGRWRWTSGLTSLSEIAAGAFAQTLLGLRFHPKLLDMITLFEVSPSLAADMAAYLD